ncbi:hypothetical protein F4680DRAFT_465548 [Xylaria scruposa]|nr:hypothetical protein F4680DRAFT_465548 [Xylaria scruposa]
MTKTSDMSNGPAMTSHRTIQDYGLERSYFPVDRRNMEFMEPYANPTGSIDPDWDGIGVESEINSSCAVSTSLNAYVTLSIFLTATENIGAYRFTPMRMREIIVDNYLAAGGNLKTLRFVGTKDIINITTHNQIERLFQRAGKDFNRPGLVELLPEHKEFTSDVLGNPFTRSIRSLLRHHEIEMGFAKMKRFIFLSKGLQPSDLAHEDRPELNLVIELCRPGDDGYPAEDSGEPQRNNI